MQSSVSWKLYLISLTIRYTYSLSTTLSKKKKNGLFNRNGGLCEHGVGGGGVVPNLGIRGRRRWSRRLWKEEPSIGASHHFPIVGFNLSWGFPQFQPLQLVLGFGFKISILETRGVFNRFLKLLQTVIKGGQSFSFSIACLDCMEQVGESVAGAWGFLNLSYFVCVWSLANTKVKIVQLMLIALLNDCSRLKLN